MTSKTLEKVGETVTFYREDVIGKGGYGCVYRGLFESREPPVRYKIPVAIKRIQTDSLDKNLAHVGREMELLLKVREAPNVVHLLFHEMTTDFLYLVTELCNGTLEDLITGEYKEQVYELDRRDVLDQVTSGLVYLHNLGIVHRDIKPSNILFISNEGSSPQMKLADFGICRVLKAGKKDYTNSDVDNPLGTRGWMAPELYEVERYDTKVDIFPLGCVFAYTLTGGKHPFGDEIHSRSLRIKNKKGMILTLDHFTNNVKSDQDFRAAFYLIRSMIEMDPMKRPTAVQALNHVFFSQAKPVQIVEFEDNAKVKFNKEVLEAILNQENVKDLPIVILSIVGAYRKGKSFLLSWVIRYLLVNHNKGDSLECSNSWLEQFSEDEPLLNGFKWRSGSKSETKGIWVWSEVFIIDGPRGEKFAVMLVDTEGLYDKNNSTMQNATIFALSTLLSSIQVFNLDKNFQEDSLESLQVFAEFGSMVGEMRGCAKDGKSAAFQRIVFLIRNWEYKDEHDYGERGGQAYLDTYFDVINNGGKVKETDERHQKIRQCFSKFECYLMPHPGMKVTNANFDGRLSDIEDTFKKNLETLVSFLLPPGVVQPKTVAGTQLNLTAKDVSRYVEAYVNALNSDKCIKPSSMYQATVKVHSHNIVREGKEVYLSEVRKYEKSIIFSNKRNLMKMHTEFLERSFRYFNDNKMNDPGTNSDFCDQLQKDIEYEFQHWQNRNQKKKEDFLNTTTENSIKIYKGQMDSLKDIGFNNLNFENLTNLHNSTKQLASGNLKKYLHGCDLVDYDYCSEKLEKGIEEYFIALKERFESFQTEMMRKDQQIQSKETELQQLTAINHEFDKMLNNVNKQVEEQKSELGRLQEEKEKYKKSLDNLNNRNQKFQQRLSDVNQQLKGLQGTNEEYKQYVENLNSQYNTLHETYQQHINDMNWLIDQQGQELKQTREDKQRNQQSMNKILKKIKRYEEKLESLEEKAEREKDRRKALERRVVHYPPLGQYSYNGQFYPYSYY